MPSISENNPRKNHKNAFPFIHFFIHKRNYFTNCEYVTANTAKSRINHKLHICTISCHLFSSDRPERNSMSIHSNLKQFNSKQSENQRQRNAKRKIVLTFMGFIS